MAKPRTTTVEPSVQILEFINRQPLESKVAALLLAACRFEESGLTDMGDALTERIEIEIDRAAEDPKTAPNVRLMIGILRGLKAAIHA